MNTCFTPFLYNVVNDNRRDLQRQGVFIFRFQFYVFYVVIVAFEYVAFFV